MKDNEEHLTEEILDRILEKLKKIRKRMEKHVDVVGEYDKYIEEMKKGHRDWQTLKTFTEFCKEIEKRG